MRPRPGRAQRAVLVAQLFDWYLEPSATVYQLARRLTELGVATRRASRAGTRPASADAAQPSVAGQALTNRTQVAPARQRKSAMLPAGPGISHAPRPPEDWIKVPVPPIVPEDTFAQVQAKLDANQQSAARNTRHEYLLRALVSCSTCRLSCSARQSAAGYRYYLCHGRTDALRAAQGQRCHSRYIPAGSSTNWCRQTCARCSPTRPGHPRAAPRQRRGLASPGTASPAADHPPSPEPARPPATAAPRCLPRRGDRAA